MATSQNELSNPAFRYFIFILLVCILLFVFLMSRLMSGANAASFKEHTKPSSYRVEVIEYGGSQTLTMTDLDPGTEFTIALHN